MNANDLEVKISEWRARMSAAMPGKEETVRELEAHLRDHIEAKTREGSITPEAAFEEGVKRMGEPRALAGEFARVEETGGAMWPVRVIRGLVGLPVLAIFALVVVQCMDGQRSLLMATHVVTFFAGYLAVLGAGMTGLWTIALGWRRPSSERERRAQGRELFRLTLAGSILVPLGMILGMAWYGTQARRVWSWEPVEVGALSVLISTWLLLLVQVRPRFNDRVRAVLALLGASVVGIGWFGANALTAAVPIAWLCGAAIFSQGAVVLLHVRAKRRATKAIVRVAGT